MQDLNMHCINHRLQLYVIIEMLKSCVCEHLLFLVPHMIIYNRARERKIRFTPKALYCPVLLSH